MRRRTTKTWITLFLDEVIFISIGMQLMVMTLLPLRVPVWNEYLYSFILFLCLFLASNRSSKMAKSIIKYLYK